MRKVIVTEFMTLDGVVGYPHHWSFPYWNDEIAQFKQDETFASGGLLLGRVTYTEFAAAWPGRTDATGFADRFNSLPKYVISSTLEKAAWNNSHLIKSNYAEEIAKLKQMDGQDLVVHGSVKLVNFLLQANLIDRYNLLVYPLVVGKGLRLFSEESNAKLQLVEAKTFATGVVAQIYTPQP